MAQFQMPEQIAMSDSNKLLPLDELAERLRAIGVRPFLIDELVRRARQRRTQPANPQAQMTGKTPYQRGFDDRLADRAGPRRVPGGDASWEEKLYHRGWMDGLGGPRREAGAISAETQAALDFIKANGLEPTMSADDVFKLTRE
jgi:hypothetical protein